VFPIESYDGRLTLEYVSYTLGDPKNTEIECLRDGITFSVPLYVKLRLREEDFIKDEEIYMGEIPMVTERGSFIINGAERVVVSQLHRSPASPSRSRRTRTASCSIPSASFPDRGTWLEVQFDNNDLLYVYLDRRRRRRKFLITTFSARWVTPRTSTSSISSTRSRISRYPRRFDMENVSTLVLVEDAIDAQKGVVLARAFEPLTKADRPHFREARHQHDPCDRHRGSTKARSSARSRRIPTRNEEEALKDIYRRLRPGDPPTAANAKALHQASVLRSEALRPRPRRSLQDQPEARLSTRP
jgi:DNA-directed RNA polymerase subunit beta